MSSIGRNELCSCGSNKKYKKCCGNNATIVTKSYHKIGNVIEIKKFDDPILKTICKPLNKNEDISFIHDMVSTLRSEITGVGLAAPQIGIDKRVILVRQTIMINPEITYRSNKNIMSIEYCLSYPNIMVNIERSSIIKVQYFDENWISRTEQYTGLDSRIIQHEIDHLDGNCAVGIEWFNNKK